MFAAKRKNDAVFEIYQDNSKKTLAIKKLNDAALKLTGYAKEDILEKNLIQFLPDKIKEIINSYLEFEDDSLNDLSTILHKVPNFSIVSRDKSQIPIELKIFYIVSDNKNPCFELLMRDLRLKAQIEKARQALKINREEYMDSDTGILTKDALLQDIDTIVKHATKVETIFAVMKIDNFFTNVASQGQNTNRLLIRNIAQKFHETTRTEDVISYLGEGLIGIILFDCDIEDAKKVLQRVYNKINNNIDNEQMKKLDIKFVYTKILPNHNPRELLVHVNESFSKVSKKSKEHIFYIQA